MDFHRIKKILKTEHTLTTEEWKGAVLFLCNEDYLFLIKRSETMPTHSGQIAFVGGHRHSHETNPWEVACREFQEETSYSPEHLEFLGYLPTVFTARMQPIVPVVAKLKMNASDYLLSIKSNGEWDVAFAYRWTDLINEDKWEYAWRNSLQKSPVLFHNISPGHYLSSASSQESYLLWGATASMIWSFLRLYFRD